VSPLRRAVRASRLTRRYQRRARIRRGPDTGHGRARGIWSACAAGLRSGQGLERRPAFPPASSASAQKATFGAAQANSRRETVGAPL